MCDRLMHGRDLTVTTISSARSVKSLNLGDKLNERTIAVLPLITNDCTQKSLGRQLRKVEKAIAKVRVNVVGESRVLESLLLARNSRNATYKEYREKTNSVTELRVEHFENFLDLNFTREQLRELQRTPCLFQNIKLTRNFDANVTKARTRALNAAGEAAKYETEAKKGMKASKLKHLNPAVEFLTHRVAMSRRLAYRPTSRGDINEGIQYVQLHYAGDRARGTHFQFVSILNVLQPATDIDSLTTASIYDYSKSYDRVEKYLNQQITEFDNLEGKILTKIKYPSLTEEQHSQPEIKLSLLIIEQIKHNNLPRADIIPVLNYPERIRDHKPFQSIKMGYLTNNYWS